MTPFAAICITMMLNVDHPELCLPPAPIHELCASVTNYWPFNEEGELVPFNGQADSDPYHTANMTPVTLDGEWRIAAGPSSLVGKQYVFPNGWVINIADTFGAKAYQKGAYWHYSYNQYVWGLDVMTSEPIHYLECDGRIEQE